MIHVYYVKLTSSGSGDGCHSIFDSYLLIFIVVADVVCMASPAQTIPISKELQELIEENKTRGNVYFEKVECTHFRAVTIAS